MPTPMRLERRARYLRRIDRARAHESAAAKARGTHMVSGCGHTREGDMAIALQHSLVGCATNLEREQELRSKEVVG